MNPLKSLTKWAFLSLSLLLLAAALPSCSSTLDPFQEPSCKGVDCSGHGECQIQSGKAVCVCDDGYYADGLECVVGEDPCEGIDCSGHGECVVHGGQATCECDTGYAPDGLSCVETCGGDAECDDDNVCTDDSCDPVLGCVHQDNSDPCDDGNACTRDDVCSSGVCAGTLIDEDGDGIPPESCGGTDCDDGNPSITGEKEIWIDSEVCSNGLDDDCDGKSDEEETDCALPMVCDQGGWCIDNPFALPYVNGSFGARALWGSGENDVWSVGKHVYHFDGHYWELVHHHYITMISGSSETNVWMPIVNSRGQLYHWDGSNLTVNNPSDVFPHEFYNNANPIKGIWTTSSSDVWLNLGSDSAAAYNSYIAHWNGTTWSISFFVNRSDALRGIGGSGPDDVWSVGDIIVHWDGNTWEIVESSLGATLRSVWAWDASNAWAVGDNGTIVNWNGTEWTNQDFGTLCHRKIWGFSPDDMWLCGIDDSDTSIFLHWNGTEWSTKLTIPAASYPNAWSYCDIWGSSEDNIWAVAQGSFAHWDGHSWTVFPLSTTTTEELKDVYAVDNSNIWAIGNSTVLHRNGTNWIDVSDGLSGQSNNAVWAASPDDAWVVGEQGHIAHWNGTTWSVFDSGTSSNLNSIWGSSADSIWAVGGEGTIVHWDGNLWTSVDSRTEETLLIVHGSSDTNVWVGGENGIVLQRNDIAWNDIGFSSHIDPDPQCGIAINDLIVFSQDDIWLRSDCSVSGSYPEFCRLYHWNGSQWSIMNSAVDIIIAGSYPDNLWHFGTQGGFMPSPIGFAVWDGGGWVNSIPGLPTVGSSLAVTEQGSAIVVGAAGLILRYQGCRTDEDCIDLNICMVNRECVDGFCTGGTPAPEGLSCDDGLFCNGTDTCDGSDVCVHAGDPCGGLTCSEDQDVCQ